MGQKSVLYVSNTPWLYLSVRYELLKTPDINSFEDWIHYNPG